MLGFSVFVMAFFSTVLIWQADILSTTITDYFLKKRIARGFNVLDYFASDRIEPSVIIDKESPKGCVVVFGWIFLIASSVYNLIVIRN